MFEAAFPVFFIESTCSVPQVSILRLFTLLTCVPSFLCKAAQRMHKKMPRFQLAHPGFFALQSAHRSLPGTERMRSWSAFSWRACCRLEIAEAMVLVFRSGGESGRARHVRQGAASAGKGRNTSNGRARVWWRDTPDGRRNK